MPFYPHARQFLVDLCGAAVVFHVAKVAVAVLVIPVNLEEVVFWQLEDDCYQYQKFADHFMVDMFAELIDGRPYVLDYLRMWSIVLRDGFGNVIDFSVVEDAGCQLADSFGFIAVIATVFEVGTVFQLFLCIEIKERFANGKLLIDLLLGKTEVGNVKETDFIDGVEKLVSQFLLSTRIVEEGEIKRDELGPVDCDTLVSALHQRCF